MDEKQWNSMKSVFCCPIRGGLFSASGWQWSDDQVPLWDFPLSSRALLRPYWICCCMVADVVALRQAPKQTWLCEPFEPLWDWEVYEALEGLLKPSGMTEMLKLNSNAYNSPSRTISAHGIIFGVVSNGLSICIVKDMWSNRLYIIRNNTEDNKWKELKVGVWFLPVWVTAS